MRNIILALIVLALFFYTDSFCQKPEDEGIFGEFKGEEYVNHSIGFKFHIPKDWHVLTPEEMAKAVKAGHEDILKSNEKSQAQQAKIERVEFVVSKKKYGATENSVLGYSLTKQPNASISALKVADAVKTVFLKNPDFKLELDLLTERLGNRDFAMFELGVKSFPKQRVRIYVTMVGNFALTIAATYWDDKNFKVISKSLNTIEFFTVNK